jgi:hypothetical protein
MWRNVFSRYIRNRRTDPRRINFPLPTVTRATRSPSLVSRRAPLVIRRHLGKDVHLEITTPRWKMKKKKFPIGSRDRNKTKMLSTKLRSVLSKWSKKNNQFSVKFFSFWRLSPYAATTLWSVRRPHRARTTTATTSKIHNHHSNSLRSYNVVERP